MNSSVTNLVANATGCLTITTNSTACQAQSSNLALTMYDGAYDPSDRGARFLGQAGVGSPPFSVSVVSGQSYSLLATNAWQQESCSSALTLSGVDVTVAAADSTPPDTSIDSKPADPSSSSSASFTFSGTVGDTDHFECSLDSALYTTCTSPQSYSNLAEGSHTFAVRAVDAAGNIDPTPASYTWTVDTTAPDTVIDSSPTTSTPSTTGTFTFHGTSGDAVSYQCSIDGYAFTACTSPQTYTGLADGTHVFLVKATDAAGNTDATPARYQWTINSGSGASAPETVISSGPADGSTSGSDVSFSFTATPAAGATFECSLDGGAYASCTSPKAFSGLSAGSHTFSVRAVSSSGVTDSTPATRTFTVTTTAPAAPVITGHPDSLTASRSGAFTFTGATGASFECSVDGKAFAACTSPVSYSGLKSGAHTFTVRTAGTSGSASAASYSWVVDAVAPQTKRAPGQSRIVHVSKHQVTISFTGSDNRTATGDLTYQCSLDGGAWTACSSPATFKGLDDGQHRVKVRAIDTVGNTDASPIKVLIAVHTK